MMETLVKATKNRTLRYKSYKNSGEEWIGEIPAHWEVRKLKHIFVEKKAKANMRLSCGAISFGKVVAKDDEKVSEATKASYQEVRNGEFLINPLNLNYDLISLRIALSYIDVVVSAGYIVLKASVDMDKGYFKYLLHRYDVAYMKLLGSGVRQTISYNHISSSLLLYPPIKEQTGIAEFLDKKTQQIDQAISQKEKQIELLKERRQILIHNAVTRGLNSNVKIKDSGVEWIGEIPAHWEVKKAKYAFSKIEQGWSPQCDQYVASRDEWGVVKVGCVNGYEFNPEENKVLPKNLRPRTEYRILKGDVLVSRANSLELVGSAAFVNEIQHKLILCDKVYRVKIIPEKIIGEYYVLYMSTVLARQQIEIEASGASPSMQNVGQDAIKNMLIIMPPVAEQALICSYLHSLKQKIAKVISNKTDEIEKLKEYRATLINAAVTGKIKID